MRIIMEAKALIVWRISLVGLKFLVRIVVRVIIGRWLAMSLVWYKELKI
jgi:hypothetical protein